ncbi:MAG: tetratricopeptide repeat protein [Thermoanaerobaculia bacterium]
MRMRIFVAALPVLAAGALAQAPAKPADAGWKPFDLGSHHRAVSTADRGAQLAFDQGLNWSFAFNHEEAEKAFREAARRDPRLAMARWGVALVNGPHLNNPVVDEAHAKAAWEALGEAKKRVAGASDVEKALIEALGARYALPQPEDRKPLDEAYAKAMGSVRGRFPKDADVAALHAESLMDVHPWDQWTSDGKPRPGTQEILDAIEAALALSPRHPLALHMKIHALEASPHPENAKQAADLLKGLVPDSSHLVHMPAHIYARVGGWRDAAAANERALAADARYNARVPEFGFYHIYEAHNAHFLGFTAEMEGRKAVALEMTKAVVDGLDAGFLKENAMFADSFTTVYSEAQMRFGMWEDLLKTPEPPEYLPVSRAYRLFLRGVAHAALGHVDDAERERTALAEAIGKVPKEFLFGTNAAAGVFGVCEPYLEGEIAYRKGDFDTALAKLREAVKREDALKYDEPPDMTVPSRHALGAVLLAAGRPAEAETVYREDLVRYPENGWSLQGVARALRAQKKTEEAARFDARFRKAWSRADVEVASSCLCVKPGS